MLIKNYPYFNRHCLKVNILFWFFRKALRTNITLFHCAKIEAKFIVSALFGATCFSHDLDIIMTSVALFSEIRVNNVLLLRKIYSVECIVLILRLTQVNIYIGGHLGFEWSRQFQTSIFLASLYSLPMKTWIYILKLSL